MQMLDAYIPEGVLTPEAEKSLLRRLTDPSASCGVSPI